MDSIKFSMKQKVYSVLDNEACGIVTGIIFRPSGALYYVSWSDFVERVHYECELSECKSVLID